MNTTANIVDANEVRRLLRNVANQLAEDKPEILVALPTGGFWVAAALSKLLDIRSENVISVQVEKTPDGDYHLRASLTRLVEPAFAGRKVVVVDDAANRGLLTLGVVEGLKALKAASVRSCVLVANEDGVQPDVVGRTCVGKPPQFPLEVW